MSILCPVDVSTGGRREVLKHHIAVVERAEHRMVPRDLVVTDDEMAVCSTSHREPLRATRGPLPRSGLDVTVTHMTNHSPCGRIP
jgi:hypothetical protein